MMDYRETNRSKNRKQQHAHCSDHLYQRLSRRYPSFVQEMIQDLLKVEGYSDVEIAFGAKISLDIIRRLSLSQPVLVDKKIFLAVFKLYSCVFC